MTASGRTQRGYSYSYLQHPYSFIFPDARPYQNYEQPRNRQTEHLHSQLQSPSRQRIQSRLTELTPRTEHGYRVQLSKRGGHRKHYLTKLLLELFAALGNYKWNVFHEAVNKGFTFEVITLKSRLVYHNLDTESGEGIIYRYLVKV